MIPPELWLIKKPGPDTVNQNASKCKVSDQLVRCVAETFSGWVRFSKFRAGLLKHYMLNLISDIFLKILVVNM